MHVSKLAVWTFIFILWIATTHADIVGHFHLPGNLTYERLSNYDSKFNGACVRVGPEGNKAFIVFLSAFTKCEPGQSQKKANEYIADKKLTGGGLGQEMTFNMGGKALRGVLIPQDADGYRRFSGCVTHNMHVYYLNIILQKEEIPSELGNFLSGINFTVELPVSPALDDYWKAIAHHNKKEYDQALSKYNLAIAANFKFAQAHLNKAKCLYELKRYDEAHAAVINALNIESDAATFAELAGIEAAAKNYEEALEAAKKGLTLDPEYSKCHRITGEVYQKIGDTDSAILSFEKCLEINPCDRVSLRELYQIYNAQKNDPVTASQYKKLLISYYPAEAGLNIAAKDTDESIQIAENEKKQDHWLNNIADQIKTEKRSDPDSTLSKPGVQNSPEAASVPHSGEDLNKQEDFEPCILPISGNEPVKPDSEWTLGLADKPGELLDAMGGGRPGGDVTAMMALLRQSGGPLNDSEDREMNSKWAPYAASKSPNARKAIRKQTELLMQSMMHRQMMIQAAWEYDFAIAQRQMAVMMDDKEAAESAEMIAELQQQTAESIKTHLDRFALESEKAPQIPTPEELKAEEDAERENAENALFLTSEPSTPDVPEQSGKKLLGYLKHIKNTVEIKPYLEANPSTGTCVLTDNSANFTRINKWPNDVTDIHKYECRWETPGVIPIYSDHSVIEHLFPFKITVRDAGTKFSPKSSVQKVTLGVQYQSSSSTKAENISIEAPGTSVASIDKVQLEFTSPDTRTIEIAEDQVINIDDMGRWHTKIHYKFEPLKKDSEKPSEKSKQDPALGASENECIAEHESNIRAAKRALEGIRKEMVSEKDKARCEELRLQSLHLEQDIHDSKDLIESIRTGSLVKTRGPWDEHATAVMARTSMELAETCRRAQQMQASFVRMNKILEKYNPEEARSLYEGFRSQMVQGIYQPGGFEKAQKALDALYGTTASAIEENQKKNYADLDVRKAQLASAEWNLAAVEGVKKNCGRAIFAGTIFTGMGAGIALNMVYEGACTSVESGPREAVKNAAVQGGVLIASMGVIKAGGWAINKFLNPKVAQSEINTFRNALEKHRYNQELEWNQALVNNLKEKALAMDKFKPSKTGQYFKTSRELNDAVAAANSSSLAKNIMKNELAAAEKALAEKGTKEAASRLNEIRSYQDMFNNRLHTNIYPQTDNRMLIKLRDQGYNTEASWFREFRNATSRGVNRDRDLGLIAGFEGKLLKDNSPVSLTQFMKDGQKAYNSAYREVTGRSATLADQSITTTAHREAFPLKWLEQKLGDAGDPRDYAKAGNAIYNKVRNAMAGPDPAFVNLKKACGSLSKDIKTKVLQRIENPPAGSKVIGISGKAAGEHWSNVGKVMDDFASDKIDPLTAMRKLQELTGSTSITQSAAKVQRLLRRLGGSVN